MSEREFLMSQYWALTERYSTLPDGRAKNELRGEIISLCESIVAISPNIFLDYEIALLKKLDELEEWYEMRMKEVKQMFRR